MKISSPYIRKANPRLYAMDEAIVYKIVRCVEVKGKSTYPEYVSYCADSIPGAEPMKYKKRNWRVGALDSYLFCYATMEAALLIQASLPGSGFEVWKCQAREIILAGLGQSISPVKWTDPAGVKLYPMINDDILCKRLKLLQRV